MSRHSRAYVHEFLSSVNPCPWVFKPGNWDAKASFQISISLRSIVIELRFERYGQVSHWLLIWFRMGLWYSSLQNLGEKYSTNRMAEPALCSRQWWANILVRQKCSPLFVSRIYFLKSCIIIYQYLATIDGNSKLGPGL